MTISLLHKLLSRPITRFSTWLIDWLIDWFTFLYSAENVGNFYSNLFKSSEDAALYLTRDLTSAVQSISAWHASMLFDSKSDSVQTIPVWLQDVLVNGLSFWRSGLYLRDGRWRQFEALDCIDIDSVHNDFQREIPYVLFYPDLVENVMQAWAKYQSQDGHILETLATGCISPTSKLDRCVWSWTRLLILQVAEVWSSGWV